MHAVEEYVSALCHMRYNGGRVKSLDANTLILYDLSCWGQGQVNMFHQRFPGYDVECVASDTSLSGFVVIIRRPWYDRVVQWTTAYVTVVFGVAACLYYLHSVGPVVGSG
jgi:hypothetical protein